MITLLKSYLERFYKMTGSPVKYALLVNFLLFGLVLLLVTPTYETNDDVGMIIIESGNSNMLAPSEYVLFSNIILSTILKNLNIFNNQIPWHTIYIILALFVSYSIVFYAIIKKIGYKYATVFFLITFLAYGINSLIALQFTKTASIVSIAAYMLLFFDYKDDKKNHKIYVRYIASVFLFFFSSLIRFDSFFLISLAFAPIFIYIFFIDKFYLLKRLGILVVAFLFIVAGFLYNNAAYKQWGNFMEYNTYRANIVDYSAFDKISQNEKNEILNKVGWSSNDLNTIESWVFADKNVYSLEKLKIINDYTMSKIKDKGHIVTIFKQLIRSAELKKPIIKLLFLVVFLAAFLFFIPSNKIFGFLSIFNIISIITLFITVAIFYKMPPNRVLEGMILAVILFSYLLIDKIILPTKIRMYCFLFFALFAINNIRVVMADNRSRKQTKEYTKFINWAIENKNKYIYLGFRGASNNEQIPVYSNAYTLSEINMISMGTMQNSPAIDSVIYKLGIKDGLLLKHLDNPSFVLLHRDNNESVVSEQAQYQYLLTFMKEHYGITGRFKEIASFPVNKMKVHAVQFEKDTIQTP